MTPHPSTGASSETECCVMRSLASRVLVTARRFSKLSGRKHRSTVRLQVGTLTGGSDGAHGTHCFPHHTSTLGLNGLLSVCLGLCCCCNYQLCRTGSSSLLPRQQPAMVQAEGEAGNSSQMSDTHALQLWAGASVYLDLSFPISKMDLMMSSASPYK